jgi:hypothetical protein
MGRILSNQIQQPKLLFLSWSISLRLVRRLLQYEITCSRPSYSWLKTAPIAWSDASGLKKEWVSEIRVWVNPCQINAK